MARKSRPSARTIKQLRNTTAQPRSMPRRGAKTTALAKVNAIQEVEEASDIEGLEDVKEEIKEEEMIDEEEEDVEDLPRFEYIDIQPKDPQDVFQTFNTKSELEPGLCIVRSVGRGKYEIVNLQSTTAIDMTTPVMSKELRNNKEKLAMFALGDMDWKAAEFVCHQAKMGAGPKLFHFLRLPLEIRFVIYEMCLHKEKGLKSVTGLDVTAKDEAALLRTCRAVYNEAILYWQMNTFKIRHDCVANRDWGLLSVNIRHLRILLDGSRKGDQLIVNAFPQCVHLETLEVEYGWRVLMSLNIYNRGQRTHQNHASCSKFCYLNGHDALCALRGLRSVRIVVDRDDQNTWNRAVIKKSDMVKYEKYLQDLVTLPKPTREEIEAKERDVENAKAAKEAVKAAALKAKADRIRGKKRRRTNGATRQIGDEDEYDGSWD